MESLLHRMLSAVIPHEFNILINPAHTDLKSVEILIEKDFPLVLKCRYSEGLRSMMRIPNMAVMIVLVAVSLVIIQGCATSTLTKEEAAEYAHLDIRQFIKKRFVEAEKIFLQNDTFVSLDRKMQDIRGYPTQEDLYSEYDRRLSGLQADGKSAIYRAFFTQMDHRQLLRPRTEVEFFCAASGGAFHLRNLYTDNFISMVFRDPLEAYQDAFKKTYLVTHRFRSLSITEPADDQLKHQIASYAAEGVLIQNRILDKDGAEKGYLEAANRGAFGVMECTYPEASREKWVVIIRPVAFEAKDPRNQLTAHLLRILIQPVD
jgi:hypothetical protein